ncbi:NifU family protein [Psychroflexus halocasei]|uniref:Fe-S cluster biogenesis protein NfuA, 4Fe-4S-binding domain n=1 Tax=Psychroflexus halocasei TaxID=908615 RepID=A0A1H3VPC1_9FLAO|nr:NifU family protein [Psychroflexus halocasei]SDZ76665.1 Fe-S cluster biogenesis protein NfuA, 4Fe-4S-binding domain [Psychroflexus halocasei]
MQSFTVDAKPTNKPTIFKFEVNVFLTKNNSFEFKNIEEAQISPLATKLFYLPFVKTVFISQNYIGVEKYNIAEWDDVKNDVADLIKEFLESGQEVVVKEVENDKKKVPVTVYAESTPNPAVMKFVANKKLVIEMAEFKNIDETENAPMIEKLFHFPFVKEVFVDSNYISIQKYDMAEWDDVTLELREFIRTYIEDGGDIVRTGAVSSKNSEEKSSSAPQIDVSKLDDISKKIVEILDEYIKPAVASDGGNIAFKNYDKNSKQVEVILQGACSGCPSSTITLKNGIETMLKEMLGDSVSEVVAHNG